MRRRSSGYKPDGARTMRARFAGKCSACGKLIAVGHTVRWTRTGGVSRTVCQSCYSGGAVTSPETARRADPVTVPAAAAMPTGGRGGLRAMPDAGDCCCIRGADGVYRAEVSGGVTGLLELAGRTGWAAAAMTGNAALADERGAETGRDYWYNGRTLAGLSAALADPGETLTAAVSAMADRLSGAARLPTRRGRRTVRRLDAGDDIPEPTEYLAGNPDCWSEVRRVPRPRRRVRIGINAAVSCERQARELLYRGAAAVALVDWYQAQGVAVELVLFSACRDLVDGSVGSMTVIRSVLKSFDGPLDIGALALATGDIGFYRRAMLAVKTRAAFGQVWASLGTVARLPAADGSACDVLIDSDITSEGAAVAAIQAVTGGAVESAA